ncbi:MAG: glycine--tRNA ligase [Candidatus Pacebacteria bacterium]|nr:glycine--tRNA ligase [Candidatus Paceibacterota bacterium]
MEKIVSLAKRRGFVFQGSEIYGGLAGTWDYGHYGVALKNNIKQLWWKQFVLDREDMYGLDAAILMNPRTWEASGHVGGFADPMVECKKCKRRFRADHLEDKNKCPECAGELGEEKQFNMMFKTQVGASEDESSIAYLRPETAQGIFVNFKNVMDTMHPKLPFGIAQIGKAFRNEIAPRDFIFRVREFEQMEIEYFVNPENWKENFEALVKDTKQFFTTLGLSPENIHELEIEKEDLAHYSQRTIDFEFDYPFGKKELSGLAYRTDFDLKSHIEASGQKLDYLDQETNEKIIPHVIEPSFGIDRLVLAILSDAYAEDEMDGEVRTYLKLAPAVAPIKVAVFPLLKNRPELQEKAREVYAKIKKEIPQIIFDDNGNVGKRYRRQDEIGTPFCITIDFETLEQNSGVTVRDRDSGKQDRVSEDDLISYLKGRL